MAVTETPPETVAASDDAPAAAPRPAPSGLAGVLGTGDHKAVGRLYIGFSILFGLGVAVAGALVNLERVKPETLSILSRDTVFQWTTLHNIADPYLFVAPLLLGLALVVVPLQVGASTIAFPRAAAASFWTWLVGSGLLIAAYAMNGGPGGGKAEGVDLFVVAMGLVVLGLLLGALCVATTVLALRAPGMSLKRTPFFAWSALVASVMWLVSLPVLFGTLILIYVDHRHAAVSYGQNAGIADKIAWAIGHPQVYLIAVPLLGFAADAFGTAAKGRQPFRGVLLGAIAAFGILGFGAYLQTSDPQGPRTPAAIVLAFLAVLPILATLGLIAEGVRRGTFKLAGPVLYAVSGLLVLLLGVAAGAVDAITAIKAGPAADGAVTHAVLFAALIGGLGGIHHWATKVLGKPVNEGLGRLAPLLLLVGTAVYVIPDLISGWFGDGAEKTVGTEGLNVVMVIGFAVAGLGAIVGLVSILAGLGGKRDEDVPADPWGGLTLEWTTASPPVLGNFAELPSVTSAEPLLDGTEEKA